MPSLGHAHTIGRIAEEYHDMVIGLIDDSLWIPAGLLNSDRLAYIRYADKQHRKTTFLLEERQQMLYWTLTDVGLGSRSEIVVIGRPEYDTVRFNNQFPKDTYDLCFPRPQNGQEDDFERYRDRHLPRILGRKAMFIVTYLTLHNADTHKEALEKGSDIWRSHMTPSTYQYFLEINGSERLYA